MFNRITPKTDSQLTQSDVANLVLAQAIENVSRLTGVSSDDALKLLATQISANQKKPQASPRSFQQPLLEQNEFQFIAELF
ncbi:hypothetical protein [Litorilituus sediminis]|uniref:Uncharacterized protein n=1 Tax=Litorilituus sediminis TaxID=718192 RepID=A0A4P6P7M2_9GAMM|nr:hypothetical protein [Litorilituus sediminis]QBG35445.1 hypothetical protein EMK97_06785 [Litorilituus sediminis]